MAEIGGALIALILSRAALVSGVPARPAATGDRGAWAVETGRRAARAMAYLARPLAAKIWQPIQVTGIR